MDFRDPDLFAFYVLQQLPKAVNEDPTLEERHFAHGYEDGDEGQHIFMSKTMILIQKMIFNGLEKEAFQALVLLKSLYKMTNRRFAEDKNQPSGHAKMDKAIRGFVGEEGVPEKGRRNCPKHTDHGCIVEFAGLTWHSPPDKPRDRFWDFACAARTLRTACLTHKYKSRST